MTVHRPAVIEMKAIKRVSSCTMHPGYAAKRYPVAATRHQAAGCTCLEIWNTKRGAEEVSADVLVAQRLEEAARLRPPTRMEAFMQAARDSEEKG